MEKYSKEYIDKMRTMAQTQGWPEVRASVGGHDFSFYVLPSELNKKLPDFAWRVTGNPEDGHVVGVSDAVPEEFRKYAAFHEYLEFTQIGIDTPDRCVTALKEELKHVPEGIKPAYLAWRKSFFDRLGPAVKGAEGITEGDLKEMDKSIQHLDDLLK